MISKRTAVGIALLIVFAGSCFGLWKSVKIDGQKVDSVRPVLKPLESINTCDTCTVQEFDEKGGTYVLEEGDFKVELTVPSKEVLNGLPYWKQSMAIQVFGVDGKPIPFIDSGDEEPKEKIETELNQSVGFQNVVGGPQREIILAGTGGSVFPEQKLIADHFQIFQVLPEGVRKIADLVTRREAWLSSETLEAAENTATESEAEPFSANVSARKLDGLPVLHYSTSLGNVTLRWNGKKFVDPSGKFRNLTGPTL